MSAVSRPLHRTAATSERVLRLANAVIAVYLAVTAWPMMQYAGPDSSGVPLAVHLTALAAAIVTATLRGDRLRTARAWLPLLLGPFLYVELRWLIPALGRPHADAIVLQWEHALFGGNPSATWAHAAHWRALSELLHFAYASYYALVLVPPIVLYARGRRKAYAATLLALTLVYAACFSIYLLFPVDGPRYLMGPAMAPDGPVRTFVLHLLEAGSSRGTAFPSSHVAASVVASLCALSFQRRIGVVVTALTVGLAFGTIYGGFHYGVDALVGGMVGVVCWLLSRSLWRAIASDEAQTATAP